MHTFSTNLLLIIHTSSIYLVSDDIGKVGVVIIAVLGGVIGLALIVAAVSVLHGKSLCRDGNGSGSGSFSR